MAIVFPILFRLWHNLTEHLLDYSRQKVFDEENEGTLIELYNLMIKDLYGKINPIKYALITINTSRQFQSNHTRFII